MLPCVSSDEILHRCFPGVKRETVQNARRKIMFLTTGSTYLNRPAVKHGIGEKNASEGMFSDA